MAEGVQALMGQGTEVVSGDHSDGGAPGWGVANPITMWALRILLIPVFYLVLVPAGLLLRLARFDLLHRRIDRQRASYWIVRRRP